MVCDEAASRLTFAHVSGSDSHSPKFGAAVILPRCLGYGPLQPTPKAAADASRGPSLTVRFERSQKIAQLGLRYASASCPSLHLRPAALAISRRWHRLA
eukprot:SAG31_NODE_26811_length_436_cov_0.735905_1_plen_98_part_10